MQEDGCLGPGGGGSRRCPPASTPPSELCGVFWEGRNHRATHRVVNREHLRDQFLSYLWYFGVSGVATKKVSDAF